MTPRDHYLCAAIVATSGIESQTAIAMKAIEAAVPADDLAVSTAVVIAEKMAAQACRRWGHLWSEDYKDVYDDVHRIGQRRECHRCGHAQTRTLTEVMPPASSTMMPYDEPGEWQDEVAQ